MHSFRLPAFLLVVIMMVCAITTVTYAVTFGVVVQELNTTATVALSYTSGGKTAGSVADLDPNRENRMILNVSGELLEPVYGAVRQMVYVLPDDVTVTAADAQACTSNQVNCEYKEENSQRKLVFTWKANGGDSLQASLNTTPNAAPTREDVSGNRILVVKNGKSLLNVVMPSMAVIDGANRLTAIEAQNVNGSIYKTGYDFPAWSIRRVSGDWYSISINGKYISFKDNTQNVILSDTPQYFQYTTITTGAQFMYVSTNGTKYYLNNKADRADKGIQASTYDNQSVILYSKKSPDVPAGTWAIVNLNTQAALQAAAHSNASRVAAVTVNAIGDNMVISDKDITRWTVKSVKGEPGWYTLSSNGQYLSVTADKVTVSGSSAKVFIGKDSSGNIWISDGNGAFLSNSSNANNGFSISKGFGNNEKLAFRNIYAANGNQAAIMFSANGGSTAQIPQPIIGEKGQTVQLPDYTGTRTNNEFIGWADIASVKNTVYHRVYQPGEEYTISAGMSTLYAVWSNTAGEKVQFGIRMDGCIPDEPAQYDVSAYSKTKIFVENNTVRAEWKVDTNASGQQIVGNHVDNTVARNVKRLPTDDEIKSIYPDYDPETMYVHWYVMKYGSNLWKVDGIVIKRSHTIKVAYDANVDTENKTNIKNIPLGYTLQEATEITVGEELNGKVKENPTYPGYIFQGWSTTPDGEVEYQNNDKYLADGETIFYAKWEKIKTYEVKYNITGGPVGAMVPETKDYMESETVDVADHTEYDGYIFSGWIDKNGEKVDTSIAMPGEEMEITGIYYGPIDVDIESDWPDGKAGYKGAKITLTAILHGAEGLDCTLQWQYKGADGSWINLPDSNKINITYELNEETSARVWRVLVTDAKPHQD